jgi:hypothetical protein
MGFFSKILGVFNQDKYNKSDKERWKPIGSLKKSWGSRTIEMSKFITPNSTIIEFGAGRMVLKNHLPEGCSYTPSDIVDRGPGTIVIDLNNPDLPKFDQYDYCVFSGVLEYINDVPKLIEHLSDSIDSFIISYAVPKEDPKAKRGNGWVNSYSENEIINIFKEKGYAISEKMDWFKQVIFVFNKIDNKS